MSGACLQDSTKAEQHKSAGICASGTNMWQTGTPVLEETFSQHFPDVCFAEKGSTFDKRMDVGIRK